MPARRAYQGHKIPPGGEQGNQLLTPPALTSFLYIAEVSGSNHHQITADNTLSSLYLPARLPDGHHQIAPIGTQGSVPLFESDGRVEIG